MNGPFLGAVNDEETGLLVPPLNPREMARKIIHLLNNPTERARLGRNARAWAEQHFDWDLIASQYEAVLLEAASR